VYVAVYVASSSTAVILGSQPANVYEYCSFRILVGVSFVYVGISAYSTFFVSNTVPS